MPKYLLTFEKGESVRWLGHLDILRTFERAIRRAGLPIAFSQGFNPRERLSFASPLSTGTTGNAEPSILELTGPLSPDTLLVALNEALPPGIRIRTCQEIPDAGSRDLLNTFTRAEYEVVCKCVADTPAEVVERGISTLLGQPQISITREREGRSKTVEIRPYLYDLTFCADSIANERVTLRMTVGSGEGVNVRPAEIVTALADYLPGITLRRACRLRLIANT